MVKRAAGEQGYRSGPGDTELANQQEFDDLRTGPPRVIASAEIMSTRKLATAKGARRPPGSPRPGAFSSVDQIGNPFAPQQNGAAAVNGANGTMPFPAFPQNQQSSGPSSGNSFTFNSLNQPHSDQVQSNQTQNGTTTNSFGFTFGAGASSSSAPKPNSTFNFGGSDGNNPFAGLSQQSTNSNSGGLFSPAPKPAANSFPPTSGVDFSGFGGQTNSNNEQSKSFGSSGTTFGGFNPNGQGSAFSGFGNNTSQQTSNQQANGLFQKQANNNNNNPFQQSQQKGNGLFHQPTQQGNNNLFQQQQSQPQSNNFFDQSQTQNQTQSQQENKSSNTSDDMQTSPPTSPAKQNASQRSIFEVMSNGDQQSQAPKQNIFGFLNQQSGQEPQKSLFSQSNQDSTPSFTGFGTPISREESMTSPPAQTSIPAFAGFGQNSLQTVTPPGGGNDGKNSQDSSEKSSSATPKFNPTSFGSGLNQQQSSQSSPSKTNPLQFGFGASPANATNPSSPPKPGTTPSGNGSFFSSFGGSPAPLASSPEKPASSSQATFFPTSGNNEQPTSSTQSLTFSMEAAASQESPKKVAETPKPLPSFQFGSSKPSSDATPNKSTTSSSTTVKEPEEPSDKQDSSETPKQPLFTPFKPPVFSSANATQNSTSKDNTLEQPQTPLFTPFKPPALSGSEAGQESTTKETKEASSEPAKTPLFTPFKPPVLFAASASQNTAVKDTDARSSEAPETPLFTPFNPPVTMPNASQETTTKSANTAYESLTDRQKQIYESVQALRALNHGFMRAVAKMDPWEDQTPMMLAYVSAAEKITSGYTAAVKRKQPDDPVATPKRARTGDEPSHTPDTQPKSTTANLFQSIVSKDTTPSKPTPISLFSQPKTPTQEPVSRNLFGAVAPDDVPATEPPNQNAGKSLFDRISPADKPATEVKKPAFSFFPPSPASSENASTGDHTWKNDSPIKFGGSQPQQNSSLFLTAGSGAASTSTSRATSPGAGDGGTASEAESTTSNTADDTEKPQEQQVDLTAVDPNSEVLFETDKSRASSLNLETKGWDTRGTGPLRILRNKETRVISVLLRTIPSGRVIINARLVKGLDYTSAGKSIVTFPLVGAEGKFEKWILKFKSQGLAEEFAEACAKYKTESSS